MPIAGWVKEEKILTFEEVYNKFISDYQISESLVSDWRPCGYPYFRLDIPYSIIVWMRDGSRIIYSYQEEKEKL